MSAETLRAADHLATPAKDAPKAGDGATPLHTPVQQRGMLPSAPAELRTLGNQALQNGELVKACHMYTMAIDSLARDLKTDNGVASAADLYALNRESGGELAKLLSNRSLAHLKQGDASAAVEDADACVKADTTIEKAHMRLVVALEAEGAPAARQLEACERGLHACPDGRLLLARRERLVKAVAKQQPAAAEPEKQPADESAIEATRRVANDPADPRRAMAAADLGGALAVGAFGVAKNVVEAERYLRIGAEGGDTSAQRNLGLMLLELDGRLEDAMAQLSAAANAGDEQASATLQQLQHDSRVHEEEARAKLEQLAARGDKRAMEMLAEFSRR